MASSTSYSYNSTTNTADSGTTTGHRYSTSSTTDKDGTTVVRTARQDMGRPVVIEERRYNHTGQEDMLPPVAEVTEELRSSSMPSTPVGSDSGMALHALGGQEGSAWGPGLGRETTYGALFRRKPDLFGLMK